MPKAWTDEQIEAALSEAGTKAGAARVLGMDERTLKRRCKRIEARKAGEPKSGAEAQVKEPPQYLKGRSTARDGDGNVLIQWHIERADEDERQRLIEQGIRAACEDVPRADPKPTPEQTNERQLTVYPIADLHLGLLSWGAETGADYDMDIAQRTLLSALQHLTSKAPPSKRALILNLGDLLHYDNMEGRTERSGHVVDRDSRLQKMYYAGVRCLRMAIDLALEKHEQVEVITTPGNHDESLSFALKVTLANVYENEPRVVIHDEPTQRHYIQHGKTLIGAVHGHRTKDRDLPGVMATEMPEAWGQTRHRYYFRGHHHHDERMEYNGCIVEQFRTLAAGDEFAVGNGYLSRRDIKLLVFDTEHGEIERSVCALEMLQAS